MSLRIEESSSNLTRCTNDIVKMYLGIKWSTNAFLDVTTLKIICFYKNKKYKLTSCFYLEDISLFIMELKTVKMYLRGDWI